MRYLAEHEDFLSNAMITHYAIKLKSLIIVSLLQFCVLSLKVFIVDFREV